MFHTDRGTMKDLEIRIGLVHASTSLISEARRLAKENNYNLSIEPFCLEGAVEAGKRLEKDGIDVIVSRRATAEALRENLSVPIFSIPLTFFDVYQNLWKASKKWDVILFPIYNKKNSRIDELQEMINAQILFYECNHSSQLKDAVEWGLQHGCKGAVGGPIIKNFANQYGIGCEEIKTDADSIRATFENAYWAAANNRKERARSQSYKIMLNMTNKAMIVLDQQGFIQTTNVMAEQMLKIPEDHHTKKHIDHFLPVKYVLDCIRNDNACDFYLSKIKQKQYLIEYNPFTLGNNIVGGIITIQDPDGVIATESEIRRIRTKRFCAKYSIEDFIYKDPRIHSLVNNIKKYAATDSTLLIIGDSGTGKEIIAHSVHNLSKRRTGPLVSINCASIPEQILESELFGHEEGAFTGARRGGKPGLFELAHRGTIFLDEIGSMPLSLQSRLLRVLQEKEVMRIGGDRLISIDVRIIAATNDDLINAIANGRFRGDLFFRLNVLYIQIPPLRDRIGDIPLLVDRLAVRISAEKGLPPIRFPDWAIKRMAKLSWPGNVRELISFIERIIVLCDGQGFSRSIFENAMVEVEYYSPMKSNTMEFPAEIPNHSPQTPLSPEANHLIRVLQKYGYKKGLTAKKLGISRTTLWRKIKDLGIEV